MILGIGSDIIHITRIEELIKTNGERFIKRIYTPHEIEAASRFGDEKKRIAHFAKRFAAKEAFAKALGTGIGTVNFAHIGVTNDELGKPSVVLGNTAQKALDKITPPNHKAVCHVSLSDDYPLAQAMVIISAEPLGA
jgi:holo-[acyl-carrier protein] synthase